jgi:hypothetical protein
MANKISYTDAYQLVSKKILIGKMSLQCIDKQIEFATYSKKIQDMSIEIGIKKKALVEKLNTILEQQLREFTEERQKECAAIYCEINYLEDPKPEYIKYCRLMDKISDDLANLLLNIESIEKTIPEEQLITNYKISVKEELPQTCAQEANL